MTDNRAGIKVTFSVPESEVQEVRQILSFCRNHGIPYSPILVKRLKDWYVQNQAAVQRMFYNQNTKPQNPT